MIIVSVVSYNANICTVLSSGPSEQIQLWRGQKKQKHQIIRTLVYTD